MAGAGGTFTVKDRPRAIAVLVAVFILGCIAGAVGSYYWFGVSFHPRAAFRRNAPPRIPKEKTLPVVLQLTPDQEKSYREIMAEAGEQFELLRMEEGKFWNELRDKQRPKYEAIWAEVNRKFIAILNEEQKERFTAWLEDHKPPPPPRGRGFEPRR
jgi:hypothetical protein